MRMRCLECKRTMNHSAFFTYLAVRFGKWLGSAIAEALVKMVIGYIAGLRGDADEMMASAANELHFECPKCKKLTCWEGSSQEEDPKMLPEGEIDDTIMS